MIAIEHLRNMVSQLPEVEEAPHFEKTAYKINKKIFATLDTKRNLTNLKLSLEQQDLFSLAAPESIFAVPNKWGLKGWTIFNLETVKEEVLFEALKLSYLGLAPKRLQNQIQLL